MILLLGIAIAAELFTATCLAVFQAYERIGFLPVVMISQRLVTAVVGVAALLAGAGVVAVSAIYLGGSVRRSLSRRSSVPASRPATAGDRHRRFWPLMRVALPVGIAGVFGTVLFRVDTTILAAFEPTASSGDYGAAFRLFEATLFLELGRGHGPLPGALAAAARQLPTSGLVFERGLKLALAVTLPLGVSAALVGEPLVTFIYGADFGGGRCAPAARARDRALPVTHLVSVLLLSQDRQVSMAVVHGVVAAANVAANIVLISFFSLEGRRGGGLADATAPGGGAPRRGAGTASGGSWPRVLAGPSWRALSPRSAWPRSGTTSALRSPPVRRSTCPSSSRSSGSPSRPTRARCATSCCGARNRVGRMAVDLSGQTAVVTGGTRGVGQAIAQALEAAGADVRSFSRSGGVDVADAEAVESAIDRPRPSRPGRQQRGHVRRDRPRLDGRSGGLAHATSRRACSARSTARGRPSRG